MDWAMYLCDKVLSKHREDPRFDHCIITYKNICFYALQHTKQEWYYVFLMTILKIICSLENLAKSTQIGT